MWEVGGGGEFGAASGDVPEDRVGRLGIRCCGVLVCCGDEGLSFIVFT